MIISELTKKTNLSIIAGKGGINNEITGGYTSDLLSDVMGNIKDGNVWITLQMHNNVMAIASLRNVSAIILVKNLQPDDEMIAHAEEENIPILGTELETFEISGIIYNLLNY